MDNIVKSGPEILEEFFKEISEIENVDKRLAESLANLYLQGKLTDINIKNELQKLRDNHGDKD